MKKRPNQSLEPNVRAGARPRLIVNVGQRMRLLALIWLSVVAASALCAKERGYELEFEMVPSFRDGTLVWLAKLPSGEVHCAVYVVPVVADEGVAGHPKAKLLKEVRVSAGEFEALLRGIEGAEIREHAEAVDSIGMDGETWIFRHKSRNRTLEYRFWMPLPDSVAGRLGSQFLRAAQLKPVLEQK